MPSSNPTGAGVRKSGKLPFTGTSVDSRNIRRDNPASRSRCRAHRCQARCCGQGAAPRRTCRLSASSHIGWGWSRMRVRKTSAGVKWILSTLVLQHVPGRADSAVCRNGSAHSADQGELAFYRSDAASAA
ncbi:hypothetical protein GCM10009545_01750 [Saccharopolyspora thermophila]|uniref:Uncharacterized protein n=1 Tax=Saccharopolyspora thermophila TaxID=89367 RepID=A0ABN1BT22_9PSEU